METFATRRRQPVRLSVSSEIQIRVRWQRYVGAGSTRETTPKNLDEEIVNSMLVQDVVHHDKVKVFLITHACPRRVNPSSAEGRAQSPVRAGAEGRAGAAQCYVAGDGRQTGSSTLARQRHVQTVPRLQPWKKQASKVPCMASWQRAKTITEPFRHARALPAALSHLECVP